MRFNLRECNCSLLTSSNNITRKVYKTSIAFLLVQIMLTFLHLTYLSKSAAKSIVLQLLWRPPAIHYKSFQ